MVGFYRFAVVDGYIGDSPAEHVRRPKIDSESTTLGLDRMELGAFLDNAAAGSPVDHALACLLACSDSGSRRRAPSTSSASGPSADIER